MFLFFVVKNSTNKEREENRSEFFKEAEAERARDDKIRFCHRKREKRKKKGNTRRGNLSFPSLLYATKKTTKKNDVNDDRENKLL